MNNKYKQISGKIAEHIRLTLEYVSGVTQDSFGRLPLSSPRNLSL